MYYVGNIMCDPNYLEHHGVLGMKWGVRRYQNEDGSLTAAGKARYVKNEDGSIRKKEWSELSGKQKLAKGIKIAAAGTAAYLAGTTAIGLLGISDLSKNASYMQRFSAGIKYFNSWDALEHLGSNVDYQDVRKFQKAGQEFVGNLLTKGSMYALGGKRNGWAWQR